MKRCDASEGRYDGGMPWHARKPDPWYAIRIRKGKRGVAFRVSLTRNGKTLAVGCCRFDGHRPKLIASARTVVG